MSPSPAVDWPRIWLVPVVGSVLVAISVAYAARAAGSATAAMVASATIGAVTGAAIAVVFRHRGTTATAAPESQRHSVRVQAPYGIPPNRVHALLTETVMGIEGVETSLPPSCRTIGSSGTTMEYEVEFAVRDFQASAAVASMVATRIWYVVNRDAAISEPPVSPEEAPVAALDTLKDAPLFAGLPSDITEDIARRAGVELWAAGERVVEQGEDGDSCFIVRSGQLGVHVSNGQAETQVATLRVGDLFGEMSLLTGEARWATVRAEEDCELVRIGAPALKGILRRSPELVQVLAKTVSLRRDQLTRARAFMEIPEEPAGS